MVMKTDLYFQRLKECSGKIWERKTINVHKLNWSAAFLKESVLLLPSVTVIRDNDFTHYLFSHDTSFFVFPFGRIAEIIK